MFRLPERAWPASLPDTHRALLKVAIDLLSAEPAICGISAGGSFITGTLDDFSDLDLVIVVEPSGWPGILDRRQQLVARIAPVLSAFTGEHVHEPRLLITLHGPATRRPPVDLST